jgi:hypothetical protein
MLAALGWVTSETLHTPLANLLGAESLLQEGADSVAEKVPRGKKLTCNNNMFGAESLLQEGADSLAEMVPKEKITC